MRIIARNTIIKFAERHPDARSALAHWYRVAKAANWETSQQVQFSFSKCRPLNAERVRFGIHGGNYRMIVAFDYRRGIAFIKFIGTHAEYKNIDALTVSQF